MADREKKRGEDGNTKIGIFQEQKKLFRWNKKHFSQFLKGYHLVKNKTLMKNSRHKQALKKHNALFFKFISFADIRVCILSN